MKILNLAISLFFVLFMPVLAWADTQTRLPTGDGDTNGVDAIYPTSPATNWDKVDDPAGSPDDDATYINEWNQRYVLFTFPAFSVPAGAAITDVTIYYRSYSAFNNGRVAGGQIKVNGTRYNGEATANAGSFTDYSTAFVTNPDTNLTWTVDDVNGSGSNPLQQFGVRTAAGTGGVHFTQVYAVVTYTPPTVVGTINKGAALLMMLQ